MIAAASGERGSRTRRDNCIDILAEGPASVTARGYPESDGPGTAVQHRSLWVFNSQFPPGCDDSAEMDTGRALNNLKGAAGNSL